MTTETAASTLWQALDRLDDGKCWTKKYAYRDDSWCLLGAIGNSSGGDYIVCVGQEPESTAVAAVAGVIRSQFSDRLLGTEVIGISVCRAFNDHLDTTWTDVRLVLEKAAIGLDEVLGA